ncbi:MAG: nucleotidyl transferase AbiEii/AbiGii toxin family protein [Burkholderiaceae bacterium]|nr:nucleotidyl transferase AbiEii/AbiGii toxin family protein [Burkholderiaceae bacterium]
MALKIKFVTNDPTQVLERIKKLAVMAMFSDDEFFDHLVLKGGNAMNLVHRLSTRASVDLDFSMQHDFPEGIEAFRIRVERAQKKTFRQNGFEVFDVKMEERPQVISEDMAGFWGGYAVEFKLIQSDLFNKYSSDLDELRKRALSLGQGKKFLIDISRFEYTLGKQEVDLDGYRIFVYSPEMIVCEKLRAICQQMPEYGPFIKRGRDGSARARDFVDIHVLVDTLSLDISSEKNKGILSEMFKMKRVPLEFLGLMENYRDFHKADFQSVIATVRPEVKLKDFDFYFDFTLALVQELKPLWNI